MVVHPTDAAPTHRGRPWIELRQARASAGYTQAELAQRAGISSPYVALLELGQRRPSARAIRDLSRALGIPATEIAPRATLDRANDVAQLLHALPPGVRGQMPIEKAGTQFDNCQWCDDPAGIGDARVRISWDVEDSTEGRLYHVCPACLFVVVDEARSESDAVTVEYTIVAPAETLPNAA